MNYKSLIYGLVLTVALVVGTAYAQTAWQDPSQQPPGCASGDLGCYQPINVSSVSQVKQGGLWVNALGISDRLVINRDKASVQNGYVLTAEKDSSGNVDAKWKPASGSNENGSASRWRYGESCGGWGDYYPSRGDGWNYVACVANGQKYGDFVPRSWTQAPDLCPPNFTLVGSSGSNSHFVTCICTADDCGAKGL